MCPNPLDHGRINGTGTRNRTSILGFVDLCPDPLDHTRMKLAAGDGIEPPLLGSEPSVLPLNEPAMAGSERIERPQLASKTSGLPLTELPIGVTGGIRTHVGLVHSQSPET